MNEQDLCKHLWVEIERKQVVTSQKEAGFFTSGWQQFGLKILNRCEHCGKHEVIIF